MEQLKNLSDEQITTDARRLAEVFYQIFALRGYDYRMSFTIAAYAVLYFIISVARQAGMESFQEAQKFLQFLGDVLKTWNNVTEEQKGAS